MVSTQGACFHILVLSTLHLDYIVQFYLVKKQDSLGNFYFHVKFAYVINGQNPWIMYKNVINGYIIQWMNSCVFCIQTRGKSMELRCSCDWKLNY